MSMFSYSSPRITIYILCFLAAVIILPTQFVLALTAEEILVVYNQNMPESKAVAEYYARKREVPAENILGFKLPDSERISRQEFETNFVPYLREAVINFKKTGKNPAILLVYGVPLQVGKREGRNDTKKLIDRKIEELGTLVANLTERLNMLTASEVQASDPPTSDSNIPSVPVILQRAKSAFLKANEFQLNAKQELKKQLVSLEIGSILFRFVGINVAVNELKKKAETEGIKIETILKKDSIFKWSLVFNSRLAQIPFRGVTDENIQDLASMVRVSQGLVGELKFWYQLRDREPSAMTSAAVDSELTLVLAESYLKAKWLPNPFLFKFDKIPVIKQIRDNTIPVARLDGPTPRLAKRLVDDAILVEKNGLKGVFYIDAQGITGGDKGAAYKQYDKRLRRLHEIISEKSSMKVVFDDKSQLFAENSCPDAALYCGWYSLGKYVDSFKWQKGAVGFHVASAEASTLREKGSQVWCKRMLEEGVAATLGPVQEPYLDSFPPPDVFFPLLMTGKLSLIEVYYRSIPHLSWRQILIGDPLYTPFKKQPAIDYIVGKWPGHPEN
jgi:uncharacterized protein (TIGR03790 family)